MRPVLRLKQMRKRRRMSKTRLQELTGLSYSYIVELEQGMYNPTIDTVCKLAKALDCSLDELVDTDVCGLLVKGRAANERRDSKYPKR